MSETIKEATALLKYLLEQEGIKQKQEDRPLLEYWSEFEDDFLSSGRSAITIRNVKGALEFAMKHLGLTTIEAFNSSNILKKALREKREGRRDSTLNTYIKNINTYFIWLEKMGYVKENAVKNRNTKFGNDDNREQYALSQAKVEDLLLRVIQRRQSRLLRHRNIFCIQLFIMTGLRPCELLMLQCSSVRRDEKGGLRISIQGRKQKGRVRHYRMPSGLRDAYEAYMAYRKKIGRNDDDLFISSSKIGPWTISGLRKLFENLSKELGFRVNPYAIRRYVATRLYNNGVKPQMIQDYFGHTRFTTTQRYIARSCCLTDGAMKEMESSIQTFTNSRQKGVLRKSILRQIKFQKMIKKRYN